MTLEEMRDRRKALRLTLKDLSERSGVPLATVQKIFNGTTASPRYKTLRALEEALSGSSDEGNAYAMTPPEPLLVGEEPMVYGSAAPKREKPQG